MEQSRKTTHEIVETLTANPAELEGLRDQRPAFEDFAAVFDEFAYDYIHNQELARRPLSDTKIKAMLYDRTYLLYLWNRHIKTWQDVEIFLTLWVEDQRPARVS